MDNRHGQNPAKSPKSASLTCKTAGRPWTITMDKGPTWTTHGHIDSAPLNPQVNTWTTK